jgi:hypothetical protein
MIYRGTSRTMLGLLIVGACLLAADAGTFRPEPYPSWQDDGISQTLNLFTFWEFDEGLSVFAGAEIMRFHDKETFFPIQVAVGNRNSTPVTLTPEDFVLTDDQGVYYPLATQEAIGKEYATSAFDRNLLDHAVFLGNKFVAFTRVPSLFYPNITPTGVLNNHVQLPEQTFLADVLYFRKPIGPLEGRTFTLTVYFPQQETQMDVKFALPGKAKKKPKG